MTLSEAVQTADHLCAQPEDPTKRVLWLSRLDGALWDSLGLSQKPEAYGPDTPMQTELLVPFPYDRMYPLLLEMEIYYENGEMEAHNNAKARFLAAFYDYCDHLTRKNAPKASNLRLF